MSEAYVKSYPQSIATLLALDVWVWTEFTDRSNPANRRRDAKAAGRIWACRRYLRGRTPPEGSQVRVRQTGTVPSQGPVRWGHIRDALRPFAPWMCPLRGTVPCSSQRGGIPAMPGLG